MGIFGKGKSKQSKFDFYIHVHTLSPWPAQYSKLVLEWQRGGSRKGWTKPIGPTVGQPGRMWATYEIEQDFHVPCTLYQVSIPCTAKWEIPIRIMLLLGGYKCSTYIGCGLNKTAAQKA